MTAEPAVRLTSLLQIAVRVRDMDRAIAFYRDTLGVPFMFRAGNLAAFYLDGVRLMLDIPEDPGGEFDHAGSVLYFRVPDVDDAYERLLARDVDFIEGPHIVHRDERHELWMAFFHDGEQNVLALAGEVTVS